MKKYLLSILVTFISLSVLAQKESGYKNIKLKLDTKIIKTEEKPTINAEENKEKLPYKSILSKDDSYLKKYSILEKTKSESILAEKNEFKKPGEEITKKLNQKDNTDANSGNKSNQFLGQFNCKAKYLKIICYDHEAPDGDKVSLIVNERTIISEIMLENAPKEYYIDLSFGFNKIDFLALNQGASGPNTAAFTVYDDMGNLITSDKWNLSTGVSATIVIVKEDSEEKK